MKRNFDEDIRDLLSALTNIDAAPEGIDYEVLLDRPIVAAGLAALRRLVDEPTSWSLVERALSRDNRRPVLLGSLLSIGEDIPGLIEPLLAACPYEDLLDRAADAEDEWHKRSERLKLGYCDVETRLGVLSGDRLGFETVFHSPNPMVGQQIWDRGDILCNHPWLTAALCCHVDSEVTFGPLQKREKKSRPALYRYHPDRFEHYTDLKSGPVNMTQNLRTMTMEAFQASMQATMGAIQRNQRSTTIRERDAHADGLTAKAMTDVQTCSHLIEQFRLAGSQLFDLPPSLVEMFRQTDVEDLPMDQLRLPYSAQYVFFGPQGHLELKPGFKVEGAYVVKTSDGILTISITTCPPTEDAAERWLLTPAPIFTQAFLPEHQTMSVGAAVDHVLSDTVAALTERASATHGLSHVEAEKISEEYGASITWKGRETATKHLDQLPGEADIYRRVLRLVINALCYITAYQDDVKTDWTAGADQALKAKAARPDNEGKKAKTKLEALGYRLVHFCGLNLEAESAAAGTRRAPGSHWVRGHWRNQAHGEGRLLRKLIWIMPYKVDSGENEPPLGHLYLVT